MKFSYSSVLAGDPASGDFLLIRRPEIPVTVRGPGGQMSLIGLVDTGSDNTIFPKSVADHLKIRTEEAPGPAASVFGGQRIELLTGEVFLMLEPDDDPGCIWPSQVCFFEFPSAEDECVILGHAGFLEFFTATFDGKHAELTLIVNDIPVVG